VVVLGLFARYEAVAAGADHVQGGRLREVGIAGTSSGPGSRTEYRDDAVAVRAWRAGKP
jgi:hypothetical protein